MRVMFENITEDDGLRLIQHLNCEWKIGPKVFLDFIILTPQLGGTWGGPWWTRHCGVVLVSNKYQWALLSLKRQFNPLDRFESEPVLFVEYFFDISNKVKRN